MTPHPVPNDVDQGGENETKVQTMGILVAAPIAVTRDTDCQGDTNGGLRSMKGKCRLFHSALPASALAQFRVAYIL